MNTNKIRIEGASGSPVAGGSLGLCILSVLMGCARVAVAQESVSRPLLEELNRQTESLYIQVAQGVVRVQVPTTRPTTAPVDPLVDPLARWDDKLTPELRSRLQAAAAAGTSYVAEMLPATSGVTTTNPTAANPTTGSSVQARRAPFIVVHSTITPNTIGFVVDDQGHAMLPMYTAAENVGDRPILVLLSDGTVTRAKFVGSDRKTNITVIQVMHNGLHPLGVAPASPAEGSLVLSMEVDPSATKLAVWTRWSNSLGLVVRSDGAVAGFSGREHYLSAAAYGPVVRELIDHGQVERPILGVAIRAVPSADPQRAMDAALGQTPALRVFEVIGGSPAEKGGLKVGDLILSLAGQPVGDAESFALAISAIAQKAGPTELKVLRNEETISITVDLGAGTAGQ